MELSGALRNIPANAKVFIKPNIVFWTKADQYPKYGVITTSRIVADVVVLLREHGVSDITIGEGIIPVDPREKGISGDAYERLGYTKLRERYGVKLIHTFERPFEKVDLGEGLALSFNRDFLESSFVINLPVLKTHAQTIVSLSLKGIKGLLDIDSRKKCHRSDPARDLNKMISRLINVMPPSATLIDGIYTLEHGPLYTGAARRSDVIIAAEDMLSADKIGASALGHEPRQVPHLARVAADLGRPADLSDIQVNGLRLEDVAAHHEYESLYNPEGTLPKRMHDRGIRGLSFPRIDLSICTYCTTLICAVMMAINASWRDEPWGDVEILTGKTMSPTPGKKKTVLLGRCMCRLHRSNPVIAEMIPIEGCPPQPQDAAEALRKAGIGVNPLFFDYMDRNPSFFMSQYLGKPEYDESFYRIE